MGVEETLDLKQINIKDYDGSKWKICLVCGKDKPYLIYACDVCWSIALQNERDLMIWFTSLIFPAETWISKLVWMFKCLKD